METVFARFHPFINFIFFVLAIVFAMFIMQPYFIALSAALSALYYFLLNGAKGAKFFFGTLAFAVAISLINPLFNTMGRAVLFTYFERNYTLEALLFGAAAGGMFFSVIMWFDCYNKIMTSDKFIYIFGSFAPSVSLVFTMVLRFVPLFKERISNIIASRLAIGKSPSNVNAMQKIKNGGDVLSALFTQSLEGAVQTADSMKSRGYGSGKKTNFANYKFCGRDFLFVILAVTFCVFFAVCGANGGLYAQYLPYFELQKADFCFVLGILGYGCFLAMPSIVHILEEIKWCVLKSKI